MENLKENEVKKENEGNIDAQVLDVMKEEDILTALADDVQIKRVILNCFCEFLSEVKGLRQDFDNFMQMISVVSADKMSSFFKELKNNLKDEEVRVNVQDKIKESHKKSNKNSKISKKSVK